MRAIIYHLQFENALAIPNTHDNVLTNCVLTKSEIRTGLIIPVSLHKENRIKMLVKLVNVLKMIYKFNMSSSLHTFDNKDPIYARILEKKK